jgi:hypothetical protein
MKNRERGQRRNSKLAAAYREHRANHSLISSYESSALFEISTVALAVLRTSKKGKLPKAS